MDLDFSLLKYSLAGLVFGAILGYYGIEYAHPYISSYVSLDISTPEKLYSTKKSVAIYSSCFFTVLFSVIYYVYYSRPSVSPVSPSYTPSSPSHKSTKKSSKLPVSYDHDDYYYE